jgi:hypothetical protein
MSYPTPEQLSLKLAWQFTEVLIGTFERNREEVKGVRFPIISPEPSQIGETRPLENIGITPFLYIVYASSGRIKYIGKSNESELFKRWIRPDTCGVRRWTHGTTGKSVATGKVKATIEHIANELHAGNKPVSLYAASLSTLKLLVIDRCKILGIKSGDISKLSDKNFIKELERYLIWRLQPEWNTEGKTALSSQVLKECGDYWIK